MFELLVWSLLGIVAVLIGFVIAALAAAIAAGAHRDLPDTDTEIEVEVDADADADTSG